MPTQDDAGTPPAHGVLYTLSSADWARVCATEWATEDGAGSYRIQPITVQQYDGATCDAVTLTAGAFSLPPVRWGGLYTC